MTRLHFFIGNITLIALAFIGGCRDYPDSGPIAVELSWEIPPDDDAGILDADTDADADTPEPGTFGECEQAGVVRIEYEFQDMSDCIKYSDGWDCIPVAYYPRFYDDKPALCERNKIIGYGSMPGGDYLVFVVGYDAENRPRWSAFCPDLEKDGSFYVDGAFYVDGKVYMDGSEDDKAYPCEVSYNPRTETE